MRSIAIMALSCSALAAGATQADEGCSKDTDCKGERICVQRQCVDPTGATNAAAPASFQPIAPGRANPPPTSMSSPAAASSTFRRHLGGFFRPDVGFGYVNVSTVSGSNTSIGGIGESAGLAFGGAVTEDTILAFHIWSVSATNPSVTVGGYTSSDRNASALGIITFGPEITSYSSENLYVSVSPGLSRMVLAGQGSGGNVSNWGFGVRGAVGKEWWVSDHWGLGLACQVSLSLNQDASSSGASWMGLGATLAFSATYN